MAETLYEPRTTCGKHSRRGSRTGADQQRLMPSEVPALSHTLPGCMAAVPRMDMMKSGSAGHDGQARGDAQGLRRAGRDRADESPMSTKGGSFSGSMRTRGTAAFVPEELREKPGGQDAHRFPVRKKSMYSAQGRNQRVLSYSSGS